MRSQPLNKSKLPEYWKKIADQVQKDAETAIAKRPAPAKPVWQPPAQTATRSARSGLSAPGAVQLRCIVLRPVQRRALCIVLQPGPAPPVYQPLSPTACAPCPCPPKRSRKYLSLVPYVQNEEFYLCHSRTSSSNLAIRLMLTLVGSAPA